jgi:membrane protease YdiL (CAAX protease family)
MWKSTSKCSEAGEAELKHKLRKLKSHFSKRHGLSLVAGAVLVLWIGLYSVSNEQKHWGSFFGNAIADWSGVLVTVLATKHLYERGSRESKREPRRPEPNRALELLRAHSLTIFLLLTGTGWVLLFAHSDPQGKWGQVVGNIVSEWTQILGLVLMTKKLVEAGSEESK